MTTYANPDPAAGMTTAALPVHPRPDHLSYGQVTKLSSVYSLSCPRQWAYARLMGLPARKGDGLQYGSALDAGATAYQEARVKGKPHDFARRCGMTATQGSLQASSLPANLDRQFVVDAFLVLADWLDANSSAEAVQTEHEFTVWGSDGEVIKVVGRSDWIEAGGRIVDLKWSGQNRWTGTEDDTAWNQDWLRAVHDQVTFYHMARLAGARRSGAMPAAGGLGRVVVVRAGVKHKTAIVRAHDFNISAADIERCTAAIVEADEIARSDRHPARPGDACKFCAYTDRCRIDLARLAATDQEVASG